MPTITFGGNIEVPLKSYYFAFAVYVDLKQPDGSYVSTDITSNVLNIRCGDKTIRYGHGTFNITIFNRDAYYNDLIED